MLKDIYTTYLGKEWTNIPQTIDSPYEISIIKYECVANLTGIYTTPQGTPYQNMNYYSAYTTDRMYDDWNVWDTIGQVYQLETQGALWWKKDVAVSVSEKDDDSGHNFNYRAVFPVKSNEIYYICTRAYNKDEAYSYLNIKPNDDEMYSEKGGTWTASGLPHYTDFSGEGASVVTKIQYLTKEQTLEYYKLICSLELDAASLRGAAQKGFAYQFREVLGLVDNYSSFFTAFLDLPEAEMNYFVSLFSSGAKSLSNSQLDYIAEAGPQIEALIDALQDNVDFKDTTQMDAQKEALETQCGCSHHGTQFIFTNTHGCKIKTTEWRSQNALNNIVYAQYGTNIDKAISAYDSFYLYGETYAKGVWNVEDWDEEWR